MVRNGFCSLFEAVEPHFFLVYREKMGTKFAKGRRSLGSRTAGCATVTLLHNTCSLFLLRIEVKILRLSLIHTRTH
jgi:hypothetical protein